MVIINKQPGEKRTKLRQVRQADSIDMCISSIHPFNRLNLRLDLATMQARITSREPSSAQPEQITAAATMPPPSTIPKVKTQNPSTVNEPQAALGDVVIPMTTDAETSEDDDFDVNKVARCHLRNQHQQVHEDWKQVVGDKAKMIEMHAF